MDYLEPARLDDKDMSPDYREAEETYRDQAAKLWGEAEEVKMRVRRNVDAEPEERQSEYIRSYSAINARFEKLANEFTQGIQGQRQADKKHLQEGVGEQFANHVIALSARPDEELKQVLATAKRTGERDLARAVAQTALDRRRYDLFDAWAEGEPELAAAMKRLRTTPGLDQLRTRTLAMRPPRADAGSLEPRPEDFERSESVKASQEATRASFFNLPRRQVGRRIA